MWSESRSLNWTPFSRAAMSLVRAVAAPGSSPPWWSLLDHVVRLSEKMPGTRGVETAGALGGGAECRLGLVEQGRVFRVLGLFQVTQPQRKIRVRMSLFPGLGGPDDGLVQIFSAVQPQPQHVGEQRHRLGPPAAAAFSRRGIASFILALAAASFPSSAMCPPAGCSIRRPAHGLPGSRSAFQPPGRSRASSESERRVPASIRYGVSIFHCSAVVRRASSSR